MPYAGISSFLSGSDDWFPVAFDAFLLGWLMASTTATKEMTAMAVMAAEVPGEMASPLRPVVSRTVSRTIYEGSGVGSGHISD